MGWRLYDEVEDDTFTAAEWELVYLLANRGLPHAEVDVDPFHCPTCRNAHLVVLLCRETSFGEALRLVAGMRAVELVDAFEFVTG